MITITVAGGTRGIGRAIAEAINRKGGYRVKILSRSPNLTLQNEMGIEIISVDYSSIPALTKVFDDNEVDAVISTLFVTSDGSPQVNMIRAAEACVHTRRFIPSVWGIPYSREQMTIGQSKLDAVEALENSSLEYTLYYVGYFLDFWGYPRVKTYQIQNIIVVDIEHNRAAIPGQGNTPVTFTHTLDVAEFVVASLELPKWEKESYVIGENVTWNEFLRIAEEIKGVKFEITHDEIDFLKSGKITELPSHSSLYSVMPKDQLQALFATFGIWFEEGLYHLQPKTTLNQLFPEIKARTVKEVIQAGWSQKD
ncbi:hypothetical protein BDP81DRAFT_502811 [Colletotrichum phormii]|uniref:NmrA-like domain-containing protein n=1 Tax=Colletotrichum phormii TaxID=359342 RepID=A0AAI9ZFV5_9PEZI|nr:uncharacterized protein BDP81DRAFT_502811 [Colletotrichum phormii]KAK1623787.1 hypothetical protein BDP81DRAFT_502811 [Colletotrichum phormii]